MIHSLTVTRTLTYSLKLEAGSLAEAEAMALRAGGGAVNCDYCGKPCGADAARRGDYDRAYTFNCPECDREYCAECLKDEPGYNADGDCVGDPPTMVDASSWRGFCRKCKFEEVTQR